MQCGSIAGHWPITGPALICLVDPWGAAVVPVGVGIGRMYGQDGWPCGAGSIGSVGVGRS